MANTPRYITESDLIEKIPVDVQALLTDDGTTLNADSDRLTEAILEGEGEFESYIAQRYDIPLQAEDGTHPPKVKSVIITLSKYHLYARRDAISKEIQVQYESAVGWLKMVASGRATIPILDNSGNIESKGTQKITVNEKSDQAGTKTQFDSFV